MLLGAIGLGWAGLLSDTGSPTGLEKNGSRPRYPRVKCPVPTWPHPHHTNSPAGGGAAALVVVVIPIVSGGRCAPPLTSSTRPVCCLASCRDSNCSAQTVARVTGSMAGGDDGGCLGRGDEGPTQDPDPAPLSTRLPTAARCRGKYSYAPLPETGHRWRTAAPGSPAPRTGFSSLGWTRGGGNKRM